MKIRKVILWLFQFFSCLIKTLTFFCCNHVFNSVFCSSIIKLNPTKKIEDFVLFSVILKIKLSTSKFFTPIIHLPSFSSKGILKEKGCFGSLKLNSNVSGRLVCVCSIKLSVVFFNVCKNFCDLIRFN